MPVAFLASLRFVFADGSRIVFRRTLCRFSHPFVVPQHRSCLANAKYWQITRTSQQSDHFWSCAWSNIRTLFRSGLRNITGATVPPRAPPDGCRRCHGASPEQEQTNPKQPNPRPVALSLQTNVGLRWLQVVRHRLGRRDNPPLHSAVLQGHNLIGAGCVSPKQERANPEQPNPTPGEGSLQTWCCRLSGTGSAGATIRLYIEQYSKDTLLVQVVRHGLGRRHDPPLH